MSSRALATVALFLLLAGCSETVDEKTPSESSVEIVGSIPHNPDSFTQGLEFLGDNLAESSGLEGRSKVTVYSPEDGEVLRSADLGPFEFGEGLSIFDGKIYQLTWKNRIVHVWDAETLEHVGNFKYGGEGWGLCYDDATETFWRSDGSNSIFEHDPEDFSVISQIEVVSGKNPVSEINELECVDGHIYANIWHTSRLVKIERDTGEVVREWSLHGLAVRENESREHPLNEEQVPNGIAYDSDEDLWYLTGKQWENTFQVRLK